MGLFSLKNESRFSAFAKWTSKKLGSSTTFILAIGLILIWGFTGPYFLFSADWLLTMDTFATIITFLMVFVLQNTQNRHTITLHLKLDELIRATHNTHNELLKVEQLPDEDLEELLKKYEDLANEVKNRIKKGDGDMGIPDVKLSNPSEMTSPSKKEIKPKKEE